MHEAVNPVLEVLKPKKGSVGIFGTGHRPEKVDLAGWNDYAAGTGYKSYNKWMKLETQLINMLKTAKLLGSVYVVTGGQRGMDLVLANAALQVDGINHVLAIPFKGFDSDFWKWSNNDRAMLAAVRQLTDAQGLVVDLHPDKLKKGEKAGPILNGRNIFMVDLAVSIGNTIGIALWDGSRGGTGNCVNYAKRYLGDHRFLVFDPNDLSYTKNGKRYIECSTSGYGPSAFTSLIPTQNNGLMSIESIYQQSKLGKDKRPFAKGKGKKAAFLQVGDHIVPGELQSQFYKYLWYVWFTGTKEGRDYQAHMAKYDVFTDMYDKGALNSQAKVMQLVRDEGIPVLKESCKDIITLVK